jgi:hypothetical protein
MIVDDAHDSCSPPLPFLTRKAFTSPERLATYTFCQPANKKAESAPAHPHDVFFVSESLRKFVVLNMSGKQ